MSNGFDFVIDCTDTEGQEFDYKGFMQDFKIAEHFGKAAIFDTWKRAMNEWRDNVEYFASFVLTLNHLMWNHYHENQIAISHYYEELWRKADQFAYGHFKGDDLSYYIRFLD